MIRFLNNRLTARNLYIYLVIIILSMSSCQEGLAPVNEQVKDETSYIIGKIHYKGGINAFPDSSHCFGIYAAAFKSFPQDSAGLINEIINGNVYLKFESLPYPADSTEFIIEVQDPPQTIEYMVIAMQTDSVNIESQIAIGVYTETGDNTKPTILNIEKSDTVFVNILVDFDNLPPQPFK